ncbi:MAG: type II secretion system protein [Capsulimonadaceae bacterium]|nr:type II secretion system protein [Capsulimonadaceae bacterium]
MRVVIRNLNDCPYAGGRRAVCSFPHAHHPGFRSLAFTLIELLIVMTIISLLAAILFPVMATAREHARQSVCISNLNQITRSVAMYEQDYDDRCPMYFTGLTVTPGSRVPGYGGAPNPPNQYWPELIAPYVQRQSGHDLNTASAIFICPSAPYSPAAVTSHAISNDPSYGLTDNWAEWYCPDDCNNGTGQAHSLTEAISPGQTIMFTETLTDGDVDYPGIALALTPIDGANTGYWYSDCDAQKIPSFSVQRMFVDISWRHQARKVNWCDTPPSGALVNVAYADGHAASRTLAQLSDFRQWSIKQGKGDVGCHYNTGGDGSWGCWYP